MLIFCGFGLGVFLNERLRFLRSVKISTGWGEWRMESGFLVGKLIFFIGNSENHNYTIFVVEIERLIG